MSSTYTMMVSLVQRYKHSRSYDILDSYGYSFVDGVVGEFLIMGKEGQYLIVIPNKYFGTKVRTLSEDQVILIKQEIAVPVGSVIKNLST